MKGGGEGDLRSAWRGRGTRGILQLGCWDSSNLWYSLLALEEIVGGMALQCCTYLCTGLAESDLQPIRQMEHGKANHEDGLSSRDRLG